MLKQVIFFVLLSATPGLLQYEPNWESLDKRPLPSWYDEAKIGIFLHWGVFSVPSFGSEWFWHRWQEEKQEAYVNYMSKYYKPTFTYQDFAKEFTADLFDANQWAEIFKNSGAKYVVLTSKHHEGYTMWPSRYSYSWNSKDVGPNRDLVGELAKAVRAVNLTYGLYHSLFEWYHPQYIADKATNWTDRYFATWKTIPELKEIVKEYKPSLIWSDGHNGAPEKYWGSTGFLAWLYNDSPVKEYVIVNDRWGSGTQCKHGGFYSCHDRYNPGVLQTHKWENAMTIDKHSWGYRRNANLKDYLTIEDLLSQLASTVSCGGNLLINIGPTKDGIIAPIFQQRLSELGKWLAINGEAIYSSKHWTYQNDSLTHNVWYTSNHGAVYAVVLSWPSGNSLKLGSVDSLFKESGTTVTLVGNSGTLKTIVAAESVTVHFPDKATVKSEWAYVLKIKTASKSYI